MIQGLFMEDESADTVFEVGGEEQPKNNAMKVARTAPIAFPAHRLIVAKLSSVFAELCESNGDSTTPIQITGVSPDVFHLLLFYMYGGKVSDNDMKSHARGIIDVADRFGVSSLKLETEAYVVQATTFTMENVMELLIYAESKNLALLKEAAMDYIVENKSEVIKKLSFANAPGTLVTDVLAAVSRGEMRSGGADVNADSQFDSLHISELRHMAHEKGINVDESREMLIAALKSVQGAGVVQDLTEG
jgi:speckle-type POZ protein